MRSEVYELDNERRNEIYLDEIRPQYFEAVFPSSSPSFHILAGQQGSGKTTLREHIKEEQLKGINPVVLNTDDLRDFHPDYNDLLQSPNLSTVIEAPRLVNKDAAYWFNLLLADAFSSRCSIILDTTLGGATDSFSKTLDTVLALGYAYHLHVLSVRKEVSTLGVYLRFLQQVDKKGLGRMESITQSHNLHYENLSSNLTFLLSLPQAKEINSTSVYKKNVFAQGGIIVNNAVAPIYTAEKPIDINKFIRVIELEREREFTASEKKYYQHKVEETEKLIMKHRSELRNDFMRDIRSLRQQIDYRE